MNLLYRTIKKFIGIESIKNFDKTGLTFAHITIKLAKIASNEITKTKTELKKIDKKCLSDKEKSNFEIQKLKKKMESYFQNFEENTLKAILNLLNEEYNLNARKLLKLDENCKLNQVEKITEDFIASKIVFQACQNALQKQTEKTAENCK